MPFNSHKHRKFKDFQCRNFLKSKSRACGKPLILMGFTEELINKYKYYTQ